jgi:hypothetical protein
MGQNGSGNYLPDSGETNRPPFPSQQPPKNPRKSWTIGCSIAASAVILLCALMSLALFHLVFDPIGREVDGKAAIQNFCRAMQYQDYVLAYNSLSSAARDRMGTVDQFMTQVATLDQSEGTVTTCGVDLDSLRSAAAHSDGERMDVQVFVFRGNSPSTGPNLREKSVMIMLVFENNAWKVDNADPAHILL